ncbi:MAG: hypothetical protein K9N34_08155 [Candidatus Marinimicrobia bacterium]|nr:hypothetical protein [Candidatus Neomarinimicrobiota bacterium]MCF7839878.1 hypothetical protein [Candidatus Neomarinimicrobiota bacterium]MCF7902666.1 hypothetical protein [Candidatus Neomarinimicrobiota bacterium]
MLMRIKDIFESNWKSIVFILATVAFVLLGLQFHWDKKLMAGLVVLVGILSNAFAGVVALLGLIPFLGPLLIKVLSIPFFWILNALGYFVSIFFVRKGYGTQVVNSRVLTIVLLVGVVIGYILGKLI